jgi:hypothetical protein
MGQVRRANITEYWPTYTTISSKTLKYSYITHEEHYESQGLIILMEQVRKANIIEYWPTYTTISSKTLK